MKRFFLAVQIIAGATGAGLLLFFLMFSIPAVNNKAAKIIQHRLSESTGKNIRFSTIKGSLISRIEVNDLVISEKNGAPLATMNHVILKVTPMVLFNSLSGIRSINVNGGFIHIRRNKEKKIEILNSQLDESTFNQRRPFFTIKLDNMSGVYSDDVGWGRTPQGFSQGFENSEASVTVNASSIDIRALVKLSDSDGHIHVSGWRANKGFLFNFEALSLDTNRWAPYVVPFKGVKIEDDSVAIKGTLRQLINQPKKPFYYDINIYFDYLTFTVKKGNHVFKNSNGRISLTNSEYPVLALNDVMADYKGIPVRANGTLRLDKKQYNLLIEPKKPLITDDLSSLGFHLPIKSYATFKSRLLGKFKDPYLTTEMALTNTAIDALHVGDVYLKSILNKKGLVIQSLPESDLFVSGHARESIMNFQILANQASIDPIKQAITIQMGINGHVSSFNATLLLSHIGVGVMGYDVHTIDAEIFKKKGGYLIPNLQINLKNGQTIAYDGQISSSDFNMVFNQQGLTDVTRDGQQRIESMTSQIRLYQDRGQWEALVTANITGSGAEIRGLVADEYDIGYLQNGPHKHLQVQKWKKKDQMVVGHIDQYQSKTRSLDISFLNIDLSRLNVPKTQSVNWSSLDIKGKASGRLFKRTQDQSAINYDIKVEQSRSVHGQWGDVSLNGTIEPELIKVNQASFRGLHDADISVEFKDKDNLSLAFSRESTIQLWALAFMSNLKLTGTLVADGMVKKKKGKWKANGVFKSNNLVFDQHALDHISASVSLDESGIFYDDLNLGIDGGKIKFNGWWPRRSLTNLLDASSDWLLRLNAIDLNRLFKLIESVQGISFKNQYTANNPLFHLNQPYLYHQHKANNLALFEALLNFQLNEGTELPVIKGIINGELAMSKSSKFFKRLQLNIHQFEWKGITVGKLNVRQLSPKTNPVQVQLIGENLAFGGDDLNRFEMDVFYDRMNARWSSGESSIRYKNQSMSNIVAWSFQDQRVSINAQLRKQDLSLMAFFFPSVASIKNQGEVSFSLMGHLNNIKLVNGYAHLNEFSLTFEDQSPMHSTIMINNARVKVEDGRVGFDRVQVGWQGDSTFRRVTRSQKLNQLDVSGSIQWHDLNLWQSPSISLGYDIRMIPGFFSISFPQFYSGDVRISNFHFYGSQTIPLTQAGRAVVLETLGTSKESGPTLQATIKLTDGVFNFPTPGQKKQSVRAKLDTIIKLGPGNYIQGSILGDGLYNLANRLSLEIDPAMESSPIHVKGSINAPNFSARIPFVKGSVTILDGSYELIQQEEQRHYFKDIPEYISDQYVVVQSGQFNGRQTTNMDMHLRGFRKYYDTIPTQNPRYDDGFAYQAVGLVIDGDLRSISSEFTVLDYGLDANVTMYPAFEFYGAHPVRLSDRSGDHQLSTVGLNLVMPTLITNANNESLTQIGSQQVNSLVRSSIRPYERRLAKRLGLHDLRLDYNLGRRVFYSKNNSFFETDLLGVYMVSNLHKEQLFLNLRTDINLSSDESNHQRELKVTQAELMYHIDPNFSIGLKNINEYSDEFTIDPRWSINYGHAF